MSGISKNSPCSFVDVQLSKRNWYERRTKLEKKLMLLVFFFFLTTAFSVSILCWYRMRPDNSKIKDSSEKYLPQPIAMAVLSPPDSKDDISSSREDMTAGQSGTSLPLPAAVETSSTPQSGKDICLTRECVLSASSLIYNMKPEISPCVDFYQYACGGFIESKYIPDTRRSISQFSIVREEIKQQIIEIIDSPVKEEDSEILRKVKDFYASCMNVEKLDEIGLDPVDELVEKVGGWPVVMGEQWNASGFHWQELMFRFKDADLSPNSFVFLEVTEDLMLSSNHILMVSNPGFYLHRSYFKQGMNNPHVKAYYNYLVEYAVYYGADRKVAKKEMKDVLQMEIELSQLLPTNERVSDMETNLSTLQELSPGLNWKNYLERILPVKLDDSEIIYVLNQNYILNFTKILNKNSPRTLANYAVGRIVRALSSYNNEDVAKLRFKAFKKVSGLKAISARSQSCLRNTMNLFPAAIAHVYIRNWFSIEKKSKVNEMVKLMKDEMMEMLRSIQWADPMTLQSAQEKLSNMYAVVAYPEEVLDYEKVAEFYENITVDDDTYFQNIRNILKFYRDKEFSKLHQPVIKHDWKKYSNVVDVNGRYYLLDNTIVLPAGILQGIFFNYERPQFMNFATIGLIIGHEITHGFDNKGRHFNKDGHLQNWWHPETSKKFEELAKCMILQYNNYTCPEVNMNMNGKNCLGENIADNGGLKNAYHAYQRWVQKHGSEPRLPGLNLTTNQLFWMSYANVWCIKANSEYVEEQIENGVHTIPRFRVNGPLSNMPEFARDFNCPLYSNMNPSERCAVW